MKKILLIMFCMILLVGTVSAFEFDNFKYYNENEKEYLIKNAFGQGDEIARIKLTSDLNQLVPRGYQKVAEFEVNNYDDYVNVFNDMEFKNLKKDGESFTRDFDYKYETIIQVPDYKTICDKGLNENGTMDDIDCRAEQIGLKDKVVWNDINKVDGLLKGNIIIGVFTNVEKGDKVEWIPTLYGERLEEWAEWQESWNVDLLVYYKLDESSGAVIDSVGNNNGTNVGATPNVAGQILTAYDFELDTNEYINISDMDEFVTNNSLTISAWIKPESWVVDVGIISQQTSTPTRVFTLNWEAAGGGRHRFLVWNSTGGASAAVAGLEIPIGEFGHIVGVLNGTNIMVYLNGSLEGIDDFSGTIRNSADNITIGKSFQGEQLFDGVIDEVFISSRAWSASEISDLYDAQKDGFVNGSYADVFGPIVILNSPIDALNSSNQTILFNGTVTKLNLGIANVTLFIDGILNETNSSGINNTDYLFIKTFTDGNYNWAYGSCDTDNDCSTATNRTFTIDTGPPTLNITFPLNTTYITNLTTSTNLSIFLNYTVSDPNLDTCVILNITTNSNVTLAACSNVTFQDTFDQYTFRVYANDTLNQNSSANVIATFDYKILENNFTFKNATLEGTLETFIYNLNVSAGVTVSSISLIYNGSSSSTTLITSGDHVVSTIDLVIPQVASDTNITFNWNITLSDGFTYNSSSHNQTISALTIDNCSTNSVVLFNFTMVDEGNQSQLPNTVTTSELSLNLLDPTRTSNFLNFSLKYTNINPFAVCLNTNLSTSTFSADAIIKYEATDYAIEYYNIVNTTITNATIPINITLFDLFFSDSTEFEISFKGEDFVFVESALIFIDRQYISENNSFKTVELPKTDANGKTIGHFVRNDVVYNIRVIKDGEVLGNFNNIIAFCTDFTIGDCQIPLEATPGEQDTFNYDEQLGITFQSVPTYNNDTNAISFSYSTVDGTEKTVFMEVTRNDIFGNRTLCNNTVTSSSGTLSCTINPNIDDTTLGTRVFVENELIVLSNVELEASTFGNLGYILWFFLTFIFIWLFGSSKTEVLIGLFISFAGAITLGLTRGSIVGLGSAGIWILVIIILGIWKINRENPQ